MTTWIATFSSTFLNELLGLPKEVSKIVLKKIEIIKENPYSPQLNTEKLKGSQNQYRIYIVVELLPKPLQICSETILFFIVSVMFLL